MQVCDLLTPCTNMYVLPPVVLRSGEAAELQGCGVLDCAAAEPLGHGGQKLWVYGAIGCAGWDRYQIARTS